jgi:glucan 1,3-beta-glucosidase
LENAFGPVIVGEWSLATDNCAMWLNGFNDNLPGFPRLPCKYIPCTDPYMGDEQPGTPVDPAKGVQGPFGTGMSGPSFGMCPVGRDWLKQTKKNAVTNLMQHPPAAPDGLDDTDEVMTQLAFKKINSFSGFGHGFYFWNFRTDVYEPDWSYMAALERGWIPDGNLNDESITNACVKEDNGLYECIAKSGQLDSALQGNIEFVLKAQGPSTDLINVTIVNGAVDTSFLTNMTGSNLTDLADRAYNEYWQKHRVTGATCDFGKLVHFSVGWK